MRKLFVAFLTIATILALLTFWPIAIFPLLPIDIIVAIILIRDKKNRE